MPDVNIVVQEDGMYRAEEVIFYGAETQWISPSYETREEAQAEGEHWVAVQDGEAAERERLDELERALAPVYGGGGPTVADGIIPGERQEAINAATDGGFMPQVK